MQCTTPPSVKKADLEAGNVNVDLPSDATAVRVYSFYAQKPKLSNIFQ